MVTGSLFFFFFWILCFVWAEWVMGEVGSGRGGREVFVD